MRMKGDLEVIYGRQCKAGTGIQREKVRKSVVEWEELKKLTSRDKKGSSNF